MLKPLISRLVDLLILRAMNTPYTHINDYMARYWLIPYNRFGIAARIHHILRSDDDRAFHDHPWWYLTVILRGGYTEVRPAFNKSGIYEGVTRRWHGPGSVLFRRAKSWHRLEVPQGETAWTLFITGPYRQKWGFMPFPKQNKVAYTEYFAEGAKQ